MEIMDLVRGDRRSLEYRQSSVGEDRLVRLAGSPVLTCHIAKVSCGSAPSEEVALVICTHAVEPVAARQLSLEVIDVRKFHIRHGALVVIAILVEPGNWIGARTTIGWGMVLRDGRRARLRPRLRVKQPSRHRSCNDGGDAKLQQTAPVQPQVPPAIVIVLSAEQRRHSRFRFASEFHSFSSLDSETMLLARVGVEALCLAFCRLRREFLEHLRDALVQVLFIFRGLIGERVFGTASPDQLLCLRVVHVNYQGSLFIVLFGCRRLAEPSASKSSPTPSSTHTVIEGLK